MIRRVFWISVGVGATVYVLRKIDKVNTVAAQFTPAGLSEAVTNLADSLKSMTAELKNSMAEHEARLTDALLNGNAASSQDDGWGTRRSKPQAQEFSLNSDDPELYF